tara:strand:- start:48 stop:638 length:591 start_codon:yes stop_codon:yes gene_type:complete
MPKREPYDRVLIVVEGEKTERQYFSDLQQHYAISSANITVTPGDGSNPITIVRHAKKRYADERKSGNPYDRVYCVFDRDEHPQFTEASRQAQDNRFHTARSWPCFEYWLLLHFGYQRSPFSSSQNKTQSQQCCSQLKKKLPIYAKGMHGVFNKLIPQLETAKRHAAKALKDAETSGEPMPSTEIHLLVEYLQHIKG